MQSQGKKQNHGLENSYPFTWYLENQCLILFKVFNSCTAFEKFSTNEHTFLEKEYCISGTLKYLIGL